MKLTWRSELATICTTALEAAWLSPVLLLLSYSTATPGRAFVGLPLFVLLYVARLTVRYLTEAQLDLGRSRTLLVYLVAASLLLLLKLHEYASMPWLSAAWLRQLVFDLATISPAVGGVFLTSGTAVYMWWRALRVTAQGANPSYFFRQFEIGLVAIVVCVFLAGRAGLGGAFVPWIFWFFLWGLLAVAVTRLEDLASNRSSSVESYWLPILFAVTVLVLLGGGIVSLVYSHEFIAAMRVLLHPVGRAVELLYNGFVTVVLLVVLPFAYIIDFILRLIMRLLGPAQEQEPTQMPAGPFDQLQEMQRQVAGLPLELQAVLRWLLVILMLIIVLRLLQGMLRRRRAVAESDVEETHESVFALADLLADLRAFWRRLLNRLGIGRVKTVVLTPVLATPEERAAFSVRQIYQRLLEMAATLGRPRPTTSTPYEYLSDLNTLLPASQGDLSAMTDLYVRARYGLGAADEDVETAQQAWLRVSDEGKRLREEMARQRREDRGGRLFPMA